MDIEILKVLLCQNWRIYTSKLNVISEEPLKTEVNRLKCIECKDAEARYWGSHFCEDCFRKVLQEKLEEEDTDD